MACLYRRRVAPDSLYTTTKAQYYQPSEKESSRCTTVFSSPTATALLLRAVTKSMSRMP